MGVFRMPKGSFFEVSRLLAKRKTSTNRVQYLVRWKGFSKKYDSWEPLSNLSTCMELVQAFNADQKRSRSFSSGGSSSKQSTTLASRRRITGVQDSSARPKRVIKKPQRTIPELQLAVEKYKPRKQEKVSGNSRPSTAPTTRPNLRDRSTLLPKQTRLLRSLRQRRGRSSSPAPRRHVIRPRDVEIKLTPMSARAHSTFIKSRNQQFRRLNGIHTLPPSADHEYCSSQFQGFSPVWRENSNWKVGTGNDVVIESTTAAVPDSTSNRFTLTLKQQPTVKLEMLEALDRKLRLREGQAKNRHLHTLRRGLCTEIVLSNIGEKNSVTTEVLDELTRLLDSIASGPTSIVLVSSVGDFFCTGVNLTHLVGELKSDRNGREIANRYATSIRNFVNCLIDFPKPIIALVQGPATGLGCAMLPHFDTVYCSERAYFSIPYTDIGQTPEACSSFLFPKILGHSLANDMLLNGTTLTAQEAKSAGLVSGVYMHDSLVKNVLPLLKHMAAKSQEALMTTKELIRNPERSRLKHVNQCEYIALKERWEDPETVTYIRKYLEHLEEK